MERPTSARSRKWPKRWPSILNPGLTAAEAASRHSRYGANELTAEPPEPAWRKLLAQFTDVLVLVLIAAAVLSAALWALERDTPWPYEASAILAIVILNAVIGYLQQARAEQAVAALRRMSAAHATVVRDARRQRIPASEIVPGDIILVEEGDTIPADGRLIHSASLQTAEAALTGESLPVSKDVATLAGEAVLGDRHNMIFSGAAATYGRARAVVTAIGMQTEMGRIAGALEATPEETTPLQAELNRTGRRLGLGVVAIAVAMIGAILVFQEVRGLAAIFDVLILGVALAVAAVPEGLPAVVTAVLSLGVQRMARRNAIVRRLAAVETLGSANVIASDKTGTLTRNEMTVRHSIVIASHRQRGPGGLWLFAGGCGHPVRRRGDRGPLRRELVRTLAAADRANNAVLQVREGLWSVQGDPTEGALIVAARKAAAGSGSARGAVRTGRRSALLF